MPKGAALTIQDICIITEVDRSGNYGFIVQMIMEDCVFVHLTHQSDNKINLVVGKKIDYNESCDQRGRKIAINGKFVYGNVPEG